MFKRFALFLCLVVVSLSSPACLKRLTQGFRLAKIQVEIPYEEAWDARPLIPQDELMRILQQPFTYFSKGAQCYAFVSADGCYVLKLFRFDHPQNPIRRWVRTLLKKREKQHSSPERVALFFHGAKIAQELAADETALVYLHLNRTTAMLPTLSLYAPLGKKIALPLDQYRFVIQKRAAFLEDALMRAQEEGILRRELEALFALLVSRIGKGIGNNDPTLWRNFGMIEDKAVEFDFGNYVMRPDFIERREARVQELMRYIDPLRIWLEKNAPEYLSLCDEQIGKLH